MSPAFVTKPSVFIFLFGDGEKQKGTMEAFGGKDLSRTCQTVLSKTELAQNQGNQHPMCKQDQLHDSHQLDSRSISDCSWENRRQRRRKKDRILLLLSQEVQTYGHHPRRKHRIK